VRKRKLHAVSTSLDEAFASAAGSSVKAPALVAHASVAFDDGAPASVASIEIDRSRTLATTGANALVVRQVSHLSRYHASVERRSFALVVPS
jgi:hypothetical protein